jgi:hypothetical protein
MKSTDGLIVFARAGATSATSSGANGPYCAVREFGSVGGGQCHIVISISKTVIRLVDPSRSEFKNDDAAIAKANVMAIGVSPDKPAIDPKRHIAVLNGSRRQNFWRAGFIPNHQ